VRGLFVLNKHASRSLREAMGVVGVVRGVLALLVTALLFTLASAGYSKAHLRWALLFRGQPTLTAPPFSEVI
jgi:hypothetical protein